MVEKEKNKKPRIFMDKIFINICKTRYHATDIDFYNVWLRYH